MINRPRIIIVPVALGLLAAGCDVEQAEQGVMPDDGEGTERSIVVEIEATGTKPDLEIESVYATERRLFVVSELEEADTRLEGERVRFSDRLMLHAPDLEVRHIIIIEQQQKTGRRNVAGRYLA
ncbi:MAG: hypothetical protein P8172_04495 [Gammaproteobacteria bacterium]